MTNIKCNMVGEVRRNFYGTNMTIIEYINAKDITVRFDNGYVCKTRMSEFRDGMIKNPLDKRVYGVGYHGIGDYKVCINRKHTLQYNYWYDMLKRCYDKRYSDIHATYENKNVCEEWHNFQNFAKWCDENYYSVDNGERMELDKDILLKNNKTYSPNSCIFVPKRINTLFINKSNRKQNCPIGVDKRGEGEYYARMSVTNEKNKSRRIHLGVYKTPEEAFLVYKEAKENYIKEVADEYKNCIPKKLYDAMYEYKIENHYKLNK